MELKLKEGCFDYFASGFLAGAAVFVWGIALAAPGLGFGGAPWDYYPIAIVMILLSIANFIVGCRVKK